MTNAVEATGFTFSWALGEMRNGRAVRSTSFDRVEAGGADPDTQIASIALIAREGAPTLLIATMYSGRVARWEPTLDAVLATDWYHVD